MTPDDSLDRAPRQYGWHLPRFWTAKANYLIYYLLAFLCASTKYLDKQLLFKKHANKKQKKLDLEALEVESTLGYFEKEKQIARKG